MTKIFVIMHDDYEDSEVVTCFLNKDNAEKWIEERKPHLYSIVESEIWDLDIMKEYENLKQQMDQILLNKTKELGW